MHRNSLWALSLPVIHVNFGRKPHKLGAPLSRAGAQNHKLFAQSAQNLANLNTWIAPKLTLPCGLQRFSRTTSYEKGRGIGDCGTNETYAWDGTHFRLVEQNAMGECRGSVDYIRTWTARVSR